MGRKKTKTETKRSAAVGAKALAAAEFKAFQERWKIPCQFRADVFVIVGDPPRIERCMGGKSGRRVFYELEGALHSGDPHDMAFSELTAIDREIRRLRDRMNDESDDEDSARIQLLVRLRDEC